MSVKDKHLTFSLAHCAARIFVAVKAYAKRLCRLMLLGDGVVVRETILIAIACAQRHKIAKSNPYGRISACLLIRSCRGAVRVCRWQRRQHSKNVRMGSKRKKKKRKKPENVDCSR